jgi:hypothetical protein
MDPEPQPGRMQALTESHLGPVDARGILHICAETTALIGGGVRSVGELLIAVPESVDLEGTALFPSELVRPG